MIFLFIFYYLIYSSIPFFTSGKKITIAEDIPPVDIINLCKKLRRRGKNLQDLNLTSEEVFYVFLII